RPQVEREVAHRVDGTVVFVEALDLKFHRRMYGARTPLFLQGQDLPALARKPDPAENTKPVLPNGPAH
ncbi:MAG: hypothetical protein WAK80_02065, partial [Candidatus Cybelea sp.]